MEKRAGACRFCCEPVGVVDRSVVRHELDAGLQPAGGAALCPGSGERPLVVGRELRPRREA